MGLGGAGEQFVHIAPRRHHPGSHLQAGLEFMKV